MPPGSQTLSSRAAMITPSPNIVYSLAQYIVAIDQHVAEMDANAIDDRPRLRRIDVALEHHVLDRNRTFDGGDDGGKLEQHTVAHGLDDPAAETRNDRSPRCAMLAHRSRRACLVCTH